MGLKDTNSIFVIVNRKLGKLLIPNAETAANSIWYVPVTFDCQWKPKEGCRLPLAIPGC